MKLRFEFTIENGTGLPTDEYRRHMVAVMDDMANLLERLLPPNSDVEVEYLEQPLYQHVKRGAIERKIGIAELQSGRKIEEGERLVIYVGEDGTWWARPVDEFEDGRFRKIG